MAAGVRTSASKRTVHIHLLLLGDDVALHSSVSSKVLLQSKKQKQTPARPPRPKSREHLRGAVTRRGRAHHHVDALQLLPQGQDLSPRVRQTGRLREAQPHQLHRGQGHDSLPAKVKVKCSTLSVQATAQCVAEPIAAFDRCITVPIES